MIPSLHTSTPLPARSLRVGFVLAPAPRSPPSWLDVVAVVGLAALRGVVQADRLVSLVSPTLRGDLRDVVRIIGVVVGLARGRRQVAAGLRVRVTTRAS